MNKDEHNAALRTQQLEQQLTWAVNRLVCKQKNGENTYGVIEEVDARVKKLARHLELTVTGGHATRAYMLAYAFRHDEESRLTGGAYTLRDF